MRHDSVDQGEEFQSVDTLVTGTSVNRKYLKLGRVADLVKLFYWRE